MVSTLSLERTEIISVASGKGGTGKTSILASLGYALQVSGHKVLFIDTDFATDGLSLFLLGPRGWEAMSGLDDGNTFAGYLGRHFVSNSQQNFPESFKVNRGRQDDHGQIYDVIISGRNLYGDLPEQMTQLAAPELSREAFRRAVRKFFDYVRGRKEWDYVLVDTRGGFTFNTTDVCALSDSFF